MKKIQAIIALLLIVAVGLSYAAPAKEAQAKTKKVKTLVIGTEGTYAPFTFHDKTKKLTGYDVEVAEAVAKELGYKVKFQETKWDALLAGLEAKRFDLVVNQVGINPERKKKFIFSTPYTVSTAVLVVSKDSSLKSFKDLQGKQSAQSLTSNYGKIAQGYGAEIVGVDGFEQAVGLLTSKRVDATINDKLAVLDFLKQKPNAPIKIVAKEKDAAYSAIAFRKDSAKLQKEVNTALAKLQKNGTLAKLGKKWFGEDVSR